MLNVAVPDAWHFSDNEEEANYCLRLVLEGTKRATTYSVWESEHDNETAATVGELNIITNWSGVATAIIETTDVAYLAFDEITERHAAIEGEGDKSLAYWRRNHQLFFEKSLRRIDKEFSTDMPLIFEQFKLVFAAPSIPQD